MTFPQLPPPEVIACVDSTNQLLADRFAQGQLEPFSSVIARHQRSGRGRMGHGWFAPVDSTLLFSTVMTLPADVPAERLGWVSLISSLAVAELVACELADSPAPIDIKWPNDVLVVGQKISGILTQYLGTQDGAHWICVGIGLNLTQPRTELDSLGGTSLAGHGWTTIVSPAVLIDLAARLNASLASKTQDLDSSIAAYSKSCATLGQTVTAVLANGDVTTGVAVGLSQDGELQIAADNGITTVTAGEVTIGGRQSTRPVVDELSLSTTCEECK